MMGKSSSSTTPSMQMRRLEETKMSNQNIEMAIVPCRSAVSSATTDISPTSSSSFTLPDDWVVETRRRTSGKTKGTFDRYYYDPDTGIQFRSMCSVERYLAESKEKTPGVKMLGMDKKDFLKRKLPITQSASTRTSHIKLPDGWIVEETVRTSGFSAGKIDKYYYDSETGIRFRSLISVERYLAESKENLPRLKMLGMDKKDFLKRKLAIMAQSATTRTSHFKLPDGWIVEESVRTSGRVDKYYREPETGQKFRSLRSVESYLAEVNAKSPTFKASKPENRLALLTANKQEVQQKSMEIIVHTASNYKASTFQLPDDWVVKEVPRSSPKYANIVDKSCYPPETRQKFRSLRAVERYLNERRISTPTSESLKSGNCVTTSASRKKVHKTKDSSFNFSKPPTKIKWVLTGHGGDKWDPFMGETMVPDSIKQQWVKAFVLSVDYGNFDT